MLAEDKEYVAWNIVIYCLIDYQDTPPAVELN